jgi:hypothetical protein
MDNALKIFAMTFFAGVIRSLREQYKAWKKRRALLPYSVRNAGWLITDRNLRIFEATLRASLVLFLLWIAYFMFWFVAGSRGWIDFWAWPTPFW